ncbi:MAG: bifunctional diaminohydroxyphosphoribosylaminopyrimidine deaminase/5-amino-6-(5-phosphoribosylamino)uracil reductase RibD [Desulfobacteraceae bacterium]|jgi:diaminohydroxyphosphoribosylaminopyrimidine deaminase/5-amino-6-(5-phosphoribosylamino)uracil reductase
MTHEEYMRMALDLAAQGAGYVSPNPMVGAVVVKGARVVGRGYHQRLGRAHAEVNAIDDAGEKARGATLYVTLEPCNHHGRTPPCTQKILDAGIRRVVVAMADPNPHVTGGGNAFLVSKGVDVTVGICESEALRLNESFIKFMGCRLPFVVLKMAATLDGRIATRTGDSRWVTGPQARAMVHKLRHGMDAIMVGVGTAVADDPELTTRLEHGRGVDPVRVVLDTHLTLSAMARMLNQPSPSETIIFCGAGAAEDKKMRLKDKGASVLEAPLRDGRIDLNAVVEQLGARGITSLLIEGGAQVAGSALKAGIVDKVCFFYAPKLLGGEDGIALFAGKGPEKMNDCLQLRDTKVSRAGDDIVVTGYLDAQ